MIRQTATATEEIEDVVEAIVAQDRVLTKLSKQVKHGLFDAFSECFASFFDFVNMQVEEMEAKKRKEQSDLDELQNQYHGMKYSGEVTVTQCVLNLLSDEYTCTVE